MTNYFEIIGEHRGEQLACEDYSPEAKALVDAVLPIAARGNNVVVVCPPSTVYASAMLAGVYHHLTEGSGPRGLVVVPNSMIDTWRHSALLCAGPLRVHVGDGQARAATLLRADKIDVLVTTLSTAIALQQRATLKVDALRSVVLVWPELWGEDDALAALMTDAKEAQRVIVTSDPTAVDDLIERYARKAMVIGGLAAEETAVAPLGPVRTVTARESDRQTALEQVLEVLDPATVSIWAAAAATGPTIDPEKDGWVAALEGSYDAPAAKVVIAWDLPLRPRLEQLLKAGEVVLLVPPHAERWAAANLRDRRPLRLPSAIDTARDDAARRRTQVTDLLEAGLPTEGLLALAPLFERHDATLIAAALYQIAKASGAPLSTASAAPLAPPVMGIMWISAGSADNLQPKDIVGALVNEIKVERASIGKVDVKEKFSLVELPMADVARISEAFTGTTLKRKRVLARPDRAREGRPARPDGDRPRPPRTERPPRRTRE